MKIQTILILSVILLVGLSHQSVNDASFKRFCDNVGGTFIDNSVNNPDSWIPNTCTVRWPFPASDDKIATLHCKRWGAYPLESSKKDNGQPLCVYKNIYECRSDFTLIKGHCYRLVSRSMVNHKKATDLCKNHHSSITIDNEPVKSEILRLFDPDLVRFIRAYFTDLAALFIEWEESLRGQIAHAVDGGNQMGLVYGMASQYNTGPGSIIIFPQGDDATAQVMCYYQAQETPLSFAHKAKMLEPYYYPMIVSGTSTFLRTVNHYSSENLSKYLFDKPLLCCWSLRALLDPSSKCDLWDPTKENVAKMTDELKKSFVIARAPFTRCCKADNSLSKTVPLQRNYLRAGTLEYLSCDEMPKRDDDSKYSIATSDHSDCRPKERFDEKAKGYLFLADAKNGVNDVYYQKTERFAPQLCTLFYNANKKPEKCEEGWTLMQRTTGPVCHKFFETRKTFSEAQLFCESLGGGLSTFTNYEEREMMLRYYREDGFDFWIGMRKQLYCKKWQYGDGPCGRRRIAFFMNDFGDNNSEELKDLIAESWNNGEPNDGGIWRSDEFCIQMNEFLNDIRCQYEGMFMCAKFPTVYT